MTALSAWFAVGGAITEGVLPETPGVARQAVVGDVPSANLVSLPDGVSIGPFAAAAGPFEACAIFSAATDGTMLYCATIPPLSVEAGQFMTFAAGVYAFSPGDAIDPSVLTINGAAVTVSGQPLQVS